MTTIVQIRTCGSLQNSEKIVAADLRAGLRKIYPDVKPRNGSKTKTIIVKVSLEMSVDQDYASVARVWRYRNLIITIITIITISYNTGLITRERNYRLWVRRHREPAKMCCLKIILFFQRETESLLCNFSVLGNTAQIFAPVHIFHRT